MNQSNIFSCKNISKEFSGLCVLDSIDMEINSGEIIGLIGENGAGKSTLLKIIMGFQPQTTGDMIVNGKDFAPSSTKEANNSGIGMVYQEQSLITNLTVGQNMFFGFEKNFSKLGIVDWSTIYKEAEEVLKKTGCGDIDPRQRVSKLDFATRQMVEISKAFNSVLMSNANRYLILLDEPTSVLNSDEIKTLFKQVRKLKEQGHSVIFVSHRLDEVLELTDRIYVFKDGKCVGKTVTKDADESLLYEMMVGRVSSGEFYRTNKQVLPDEEVVLDVEDLGLTGCFKGVNFQLKKGEALGVCGVVGSGKEELCSVILGDEKPTTGTIRVNNKIKKIRSPADALDNGIVAVPKNRRSEGIFDIRSVSENITITSLKQLSKGLYLSKKKINKISNQWIERLKIKCTGVKALMQSLSGGNAQKVVFARVLQSDCMILILNHPTRGVDVGAKEEIYSLIRDITAEGVAVIILGDTLDECIELSSTVLVMKDGLVTKQFDAPKDNKPSKVEIIKYMM